MSDAARRFRRADRVLAAREYREVSQRGRRSSSRAFVVLWSAGEQPGRPRLGLTASRKVGNAVVRNRLKRRVREWFRTGGREPLGSGALVVIARREATQLSMVQLGEQLDRQLREVLR